MKQSIGGDDRKYLARRWNRAAAFSQCKKANCWSYGRRTLLSCCRQAIGVLACLDHLEVLQQEEHTDAAEYEHILNVIQSACAELLTSFGYGNEEYIRTHIHWSRSEPKLLA